MKFWGSYFGSKVKKLKLKNNEDILLFIANSGEESAIISPYVDIIVIREKQKIFYVICNNKEAFDKERFSNK